MTDEYEPEEAAPEELEEGQKWVYNSLLDWMEGWFLPICWRYDNQHRKWCSKWWDHPWAVERLNALWQAWEVMYPDPGTISNWWVYHFDPHFSSLTNEIGPFRDCSHKEHDEEANSPLPHEPPPDGWLLPTKES